MSYVAKLGKKFLTKKIGKLLNHESQIERQIEFSFKPKKAFQESGIVAKGLNVYLPLSLWNVVIRLMI